MTDLRPPAARPGPDDLCIGDVVMHSGRPGIGPLLVVDFTDSPQQPLTTVWVASPGLHNLTNGSNEAAFWRSELQRLPD